VAQNPYNMGAVGVESALKLGKGEKLLPVIDTGTVLVTKENAEKYQVAVRCKAGSPARGPAAVARPHSCFGVSVLA